MEQAAAEREYDLAAELRRTVLAVLRRWYVALIVAALVVVGGLAYIWQATTLYSSSVEILIDPRRRQTVESEVTPSGLGTSAAGADTLLLESQVELLRSHNILDTLIRTENLNADPQWAGEPSGNNWLKNAVKTVVYGPGSDLSRSMSPYDRTVRTLRERIDVERKRNTYVIAIDVRSEEAEGAAKLANRLAEIYVADVNKAGSVATEGAATALASRLAALREAVGEAEEEVESYRRDNNLIDTNKTLVVEQQLNDLNRELARARLDLQTAQARRNQFQAVVTAPDGAVSPGADLGESPVVSGLQTRLAELESNLAELALVYQDRHPRLKRLRERRDALKASLTREFTRISSRLDVAYRTAFERATELEKEVELLKEEMAGSNQSGVQLRELEREAASVQAVYESFLRRSKEAREQVDIPQSTARIISRAYPASRPSHPPALLVLLGSIGLGGASGVLAALLSYLVVPGARNAAPRPAPVRQPPTPAPAPIPASTAKPEPKRRDPEPEPSKRDRLAALRGTPLPPEREPAGRQTVAEKRPVAEKRSVAESRPVAEQPNEPLRHNALIVHDAPARHVVPAKPNAAKREVAPRRDVSSEHDEQRSADDRVRVLSEMRERILREPQLIDDPDFIRELNRHTRAKG